MRVLEVVMGLIGGCLFGAALIFISVSLFKFSKPVFQEGPVENNRKETVEHYFFLCMGTVAITGCAVTGVIFVFWGMLVLLGYKI